MILECNTSIAIRVLRVSSRIWYPQCTQLPSNDRIYYPSNNIPCFTHFCQHLGYHTWRWSKIYKILGGEHCRGPKQSPRVVLCKLVGNEFWGQYARADDLLRRGESNSVSLPSTSKHLFKSLTRCVFRAPRSYINKDLNFGADINFDCCFPPLSRSQIPCDLVVSTVFGFNPLMVAAVELPVCDFLAMRRHMVYDTS